MHRFRKKSDVKRSLVPESVRSRTTSDVSYQSQISVDESASISLPGLPPESDFRTSLILPDLSRRFSLLRSASGNPLSLEDLRSRIAEQRAKGAENQLSEEQEDMLLESLRLRLKSGTSSNRDGNSSADSATESGAEASESRYSMRSTTTTNSSSLQYSPSSPRSTGRGPSKRYSNNIFGSSRLRSDYGYLRSISSQRSVDSGRSAVSAAPTQASGSGNTSTGWKGDGHDPVYADSLRPTTPDNRGSTSVSITSSPSDKTPLVRPARLNAAQTVDDGSASSQGSSVSVKRPSRAFTPAELVHMSVALEDVIREMEEEAEDEIVMPRSNPMASAAALEKGAGLSKPSDHARKASYSSEQPSTPTAVSSDKSIHPLDFEGRHASPVPSRSGATSPRLPGYVPGMPRPMTPRDPAMDSDDQGRSHSTTPRAMSPLQPGFTERPSYHIPSNFSNGLVRRGSNASTTSRPPRIGSPLGGTSLFTSRSINGRYTPDNRQKNGDDPSGDSANDDAMSGPSPVSPFAANGYQRNGASSRPSTPSNIRWNAPTSPVSTKSNGRAGSISGRSRSESVMSGADTNTDIHGDLERSKSNSRSLRSPALPDSPLLEGGNPSIMSRFDNAAFSNNRPPSSISGELGSPVLMASRPVRSPTPTQGIARTVTPPASNGVNGIYTNGDSYSSQRSPPSSPFSATRMVFSPIANSSRSSLESAGSSYHSWDEEGKRDRVYGLLKDIDPEEPVWHELVGESSTSTAAGSYADEDWDPEDVIRRYAGLTKSDFAAMQDKLVKAAVYKTTTPESRPPSLRRRRPSTHSVTTAENRATSPAPQMSVSTSSPGHPSNPDKSAKASALLNSVINSIESPQSKAADLETLESPKAELELSPPATLELPSPSSPRRRRKDLDDVLFGAGDSGLSGAAILSSQQDDYLEEPSSPALAPQREVTLVDDTVLHVYDDVVLHMDDIPSEAPGDESQPVAMPVSPKSPLLVDPAELAKDVQRRAEEATAALRKIPSNSKLRESRKPINRSQISSPHFVMASTSVDTIPLPNASLTPGQAQMANNSKIGSRIRKIKGTFRHRPPALNGEEVTPFPMDLRPHQTSTPRGDEVIDGLSSTQPPLSAMEPSNPKISVTSPPASAPGFRGLISRWRKPRNGDMVPEFERSTPVASHHAAASSVTLPPKDPVFPSQAQSAPAFNTSFPLASPTDSSTSTSRIERSSHTQQSSSSVSDPPTPDQADEQALRQLFDAASNLGLNPEDVSALLVRSGSTSSRPLGSALSRSTSNAQSVRSQKPFIRDRTKSPAQSDGRPSLDSFLARPSETIARKVSLRSRAESRAETKDAESSRRLGAEDRPGANAIVRRTIIMPSDTRASTFDLSLLSRSISKRRRPTSTTSIQSNRSVHERAPTPPPLKSPTSRRFSGDASPPVPQLPPSLSAVASDNSLQVPGSGPLEKSSSAYDSLYEMYAGEGKAPAAQAGEPRGSAEIPSGRPSTSEPPPVIEVVEMANGETIWSIVNGLRDDDGESLYASRASFLSEYSLHDSSQDGMHVYVKEHGRKSSKSSNTSYLSQKKATLGQNRPETKVFYSSPAQIGRLIENLSLGMDAGSFNFASRGGPDRSEAETSWTVEERLEQMLGSLAPEISLHLPQLCNKPMPSAWIPGYMLPYVHT
ncbi:hypothetical protein OE88DRAFT_1723594 [Heliocybe sulcata]|uniref:Uncharacterized protein n=1 Tax=Heliocybe sulcata TaxID=5364 RepID=A0A5C3NEA1_9AGAM|nr:hypothetical protein OE88DRAFT_1723594 [Heliocybe sulcata]